MWRETFALAIFSIACICEKEIIPALPNWPMSFGQQKTN